MATKYFCDRCGKELASNSLMGHFIKRDVLIGLLELTKEEYELCADCERKLRKFLEGEDEVTE